MVPDTKEDSVDIYDGLDNDPSSNRGIHSSKAFYIYLQEKKYYAYTNAYL